MSKRLGKYILCAILIVLVIMIIMVFPTYRRRERNYYLDRDNYITVTAIVTSLSYYEETRQLCIQVSDKSASFTDTGFILAGDSLECAMQNGIDSKLHVGDTITFSCAPRYFGDGYFIPIVAITVGEEVLLGFEDGYAYLLQHYGIDIR